MKGNQKNLLGDPKKLLASAVIEIDDAFIMEVKKKLKTDDLEDNDILWDVHRVAAAARMNTQTVRKHIKNHVENREGRKLKAVKLGKSWYAKKEDVEQYLNVKL